MSNKSWIVCLECTGHKVSDGLVRFQVLSRVEGVSFLVMVIRSIQQRGAVQF
ncbi:hypothetical protein [Candidatus Williamhamiltonella defendens]|uniref:hypothetical protein n=1 Tax=Candidatus Williamhamiltonella defendens TaxID=138072 RepID=UPI0018DF3CCA